MENAYDDNTHQNNIQQKYQQKLPKKNPLTTRTHAHNLR